MEGKKGREGKKEKKGKGRAKGKGWEKEKGREGKRPPTLHTINIQPSDAPCIHIRMYLYLRSSIRHRHSLFINFKRTMWGLSGGRCFIMFHFCYPCRLVLEASLPVNKSEAYVCTNLYFCQRLLHNTTVAVLFYFFPMFYNEYAKLPCIYLANTGL